MRGVPRRLGAFLRGDDLHPDRSNGGREIRLIGLMVVVGVVSAAVFHVIYGLVVKWHYPFNTFLYNPHFTFTDFTDPWKAVLVYGASGRETNTVYSPVSHLVLTLLTHLPEVVVFTAMYVAFWITLFLVLWNGVTRRVGSRRLRWAYVAVFSLLSYPVLFALQLGNIEMVMFILLAAFAYLYYEKCSAWAWLPLCLAVASKYWYAVFLVAFLWDRRWRDLAYCALGAVAAELASALVLARLSGFTLWQVLKNAAGTLGDFVNISGNLLILVQHGHTAWGVFQVIDMWLGFPLIRSPHASTLYVPFVLGVFTIVVMRLDAVDRPPWLGFTALLVCGMLLPFQGHDYTAIHLFLPLALLGAHGVQVNRGTLIAVLFGLMLIPLSYGVIVLDVTVSVLLYPVILSTLLVTIIQVAPARQLREAHDALTVGPTGGLELQPVLVKTDGSDDIGHDE